MPLINYFQCKMRNIFIKILKVGYSDTFFLCFSWVFDLVSDMSGVDGD